MRYFSMFSGIGGFDLALNRAKHECVGYSEIDKYAIKTYEQNFGKEVKNYGDAKKINPAELPDFDLLVGGFPCQSFSIAGKRKGFEDTRGTLFFEIARILKAKKPSTCLLENVKGLVNHDQGKTFAKIISTLSELGYNVEWQVLNSKFFGVPQNRERVFIIGHLGEGSTGKIFPVRKDGKKTVDIQGQQVHPTLTGAIGRQGSSSEYKKSLSVVANTLTARYEKAQATGAYVAERKQYAQEINYAKKDKRQHSRVYDPEGISPTLAGASKLSGDCTPKIVAMRGRNPDNPSDRTVGVPTVQRLEINEKGTSNSLTSVQKDNMVLEPKIRVIGNIYPSKHEAGNIYNKNGISPTIKCNGPRPNKNNISPKIISHSPRSGNPKKGRTGVLASSEHCFTLDSSPHYVNAIRRLTPVECEKLQGFPVGWTAGIADTNRYKQLGNAVTVNVIEAIIKRFK